MEHQNCLEEIMEVRKSTLTRDQLVRSEDLREDQDLSYYCLRNIQDLLSDGRRNSFTKSQLLPCLDDRHFKEEELESVGELSKVCSQNELKCLYMARIGRLDILWSVNKLARSVTKWTDA